MPGKKSIKMSSVMLFRHMFLRKRRVMLSGFCARGAFDEFLVAPVAAPCWFARSSPLALYRVSYCSSSFCSRSRKHFFDRMSCSTHKSQRIDRSSFAFPFWSACQHSRHTKLGTPQVGQRRLPRNLSQALPQASQLPHGFVCFRFLFHLLVA